MNTGHGEPRGTSTGMMIILAILAVIALSASYLGGQARKTSLQRSLQVVEIPLDSDIEIRPVLAQGKIGGNESFSHMMDRLKPYAAINGTFYSEKFIPIGDILIDGKLEIKGRYTNAIAIRKDGKVEIIRRKEKAFDWSEYKCALAAGPRLIDNGQIKLDPTSDGFRQISLDISASRSGIGLTKDNRLLLVVCKEPIKLADFARAMQDLGAIEAMNLDGGPACGLYKDGKVIVDAALTMTNVLVFNKRPAPQQSAAK